MYPGFRPTARGHVLASWVEGVLTLADGTEYHPETYADLVAIILFYRLDVQTSNLTKWPWLSDAIEDGRAKVYASGNRDLGTLHASAVVWRSGHDWGGLYQSDSPTEDVQAAAIAQAEHPELGTLGTAAAYGQALMRKLVKGNHTTPGIACNNDLRAGLVAGRNVFFGVAAEEEVVEIDRNMAYVSESAEPLPIGTARCIPEGSGMEELANFPAWYCRFRVTITKKLRLGPFPVRAGRTVLYPTDLGTYDTWLWREEAVQTLRAGCKLELVSGWGWSEVGAVLEPWAREMERLREIVAPEAAGYVKRAAVSAIGWHAMAPVERTIAIDRGGEPVLLHNGELTIYVVDEAPSQTPRQMLHWASYIWMRARVRLYQQILTEWENGNTVFCANTDALVTEQPGQVEVRRGLGGWKVQTLHTFILLANGTYLCEEKTILPGRSGDTRTALEEAYLIWASHKRDQEDTWQPPSELTTAFKQGWPGWWAAKKRHKRRGELAEV